VTINAMAANPPIVVRLILVFLSYAPIIFGPVSAGLLSLNGPHVRERVDREDGELGRV
jgi:hypothetical protein